MSSKLIDYEKGKGEYKARLASFGDPVLDTLASMGRVPPDRPAKVAHQFPEKCPGCGKTAILFRQYVALLCADCHRGIDEAVARNGVWE